MHNSEGDDPHNALVRSRFEELETLVHMPVVKRTKMESGVPCQFVIVPDDKRSILIHLQLVIKQTIDDNTGFARVADSINSSSQRPRAK